MNVSRKPNSSQPVQSEEKVKQLFDIKVLDQYCRLVVSENQNIRINNLNIIKDLFDRIEPSHYGGDIERINRVQFIKRGLEARLSKKLNDKDMIIQYINGGLIDAPLLENASSMKEISTEELAYLTEQANELAKSYFVDESYDKIVNLATNLKNSNYTRRSDVVNEIQDLTSQLNMKFNKMDDMVNSSIPFSLIPGEFDSSVADIYAKETSPSRILRTGMVGLNKMLNGGFQANRVYMILAIAAGGKSFTMLDLAMQIKKYNKDYIPHDRTKIPTIVFLTMENSKEENVSRMLSMVSGKSFTEMTYEESLEAFRSNGLGYDPETDPIDIMMIYKPNLSINTNYMYVLMDKLREQGREPICFFQDHIKRIKAVNTHKDMRLDLGEIVNEFKAFANETGIPVITDSHLNREAARALDESSGDNQKDLMRTLGSHNVSESYLMIDNTDLAMIICKHPDELGNSYMGFKCIKTRTRCDLEYFYQPYVLDNQIKLIEDINDVVPAFRQTLCSENIASNDGVNLRRGANKSKGYNRPNIDDDDDDNFFSEDVMGNVMAEAIPNNNILLPDNNNRSSFSTVGAPSQPIYPVVQVQQNVVYDQYAIYDEFERLIETGKGDPLMYFFDENGIVNGTSADMPYDMM